MIHIYENWYLDSDKYNILLGQINTYETQHKFFPGSVSYHNSIGNALTFLLQKLEKEMTAQEKESLEALADRLIKVNNEFYVQIQAITSDLKRF